MEDEKIGSCSDFGPKYDFCLDAGWWKEGISYSVAIESATSLSQPSLLEKEFNERADRWQKETGFQSSPMKRFMHEDYQIIMTMGEDVIPIILKRMQTNPDDWFWALKHLARHDAAQGKETFEDAVKAWLDWGRKEEYIA